MAFPRSHNMNDDKPASGPSSSDCLEAVEPGGKSEGVGTRYPCVQASALPVIDCKVGQTYSLLQASFPHL